MRLRALLLTLLTAVACGEPVTQARLSTSIALILQAEAGSPVPLDGERVDVSISAADIPTPIFGSFRFTGDSARADLRVPVGRDRLVAVAVFDSSNVLIASGEALVDVGGGVSVNVPVPIVPSSGEQPIVVTVGSVTLGVAPGSVLLLVGGTSALTVTITDELGRPIQGASPSFASSNPAIAAVSADGTITGKIQGVTAVTVTALGVAARIPVSVSIPVLRSP